MAIPDTFAQLALAFTDPLQHEYEIIRPIVLFAETVAECSRQTGVERTQVGEQAQTFEELQQHHAAFVETFNTTAHWAHRDRADTLRMPTAVLAWVHGRRVNPDELRQVLRHLQFERSIRPNGYIRTLVSVRRARSRSPPCVGVAV